MVALLALAGCSRDAVTDPPRSDAAVMVLETPYTDDGALLLTLTGPGIDSLQPVGAAGRMFVRNVSAAEVRILVVGDIASGPLLRFRLAAAAQLRDYRARVDAAASRSDEARAGTVGYGATLVKSDE